ncbi:MAG: hypothetical protein RLZ33_1836 [Bacteroidota bacterium]|jgi:hypothetical protein
MINKLIILLFCAVSYTVSGQIQLIANQNVPEFYNPSKQIDSSTNLQDFPAHIQKKTLNCLKWYTKEFYDSIHFIKGQFIDLKQITNTGFFEDSTTFAYFDIEHPIPSYELYFGLTDRSLNIQQIIIKIDLDEYGQVLAFNWPYFSVKKSAFRSSDQILTLLNEGAKDLNYALPDKINFVFKENEREFYWEFGYNLPTNVTNEPGSSSYVSSISQRVISIPAFERKR